MKKSEQRAILEATLEKDPDNQEARDALMTLSKHKYRARKTTLCHSCGADQHGAGDSLCPCGDSAWVTFDSKREANYYQELLLRQTAGELKKIQHQPEFTLQEGFEKAGKRYRPIKYRADFLIYYSDGRVEVIDVKGYKTKEFKIKEKLFHKRYPDLALRLP